MTLEMLPTTTKESGCGVHSVHAVDQDVVEFARLGQKVSLNFTVRVRNRATFNAIMAAVLGGNRFDPHEVADTIGDVFDDSGGVEFGAESSTVLYIHVPSHPRQRIGAPRGGESSEDYTTEQRREFAQRVMDWARSVGADEVSAEQFPDWERVRNGPGDNPFRVRVWWD